MPESKTLLHRLKPAWTDLSGFPPHSPAASKPLERPEHTQGEEILSQRARLLACPEPRATSHGTTDAERSTPEHWLRRVEMERGLSPGDEPVVLVSFASEDFAWVEELHAFLEPKLSDLRDATGRPYELWNFSDAKRGTSPGDEFPEIVAEKMWQCRAAIVLLSRDYFKSQYCRNIELPFLIWRWEHHNLPCLPVKLGTIPINKVRVTLHKGPSRTVLLDEIIDDRQAAIDFAGSPHRDLNLKQLKEAGLEAEIEKRFDGLGHRVVAVLKTRFAAQDRD
jgi:hypothetical protein